MNAQCSDVGRPTVPWLRGRLAVLLEVVDGEGRVERAPSFDGDVMAFLLSFHEPVALGR